MVGGLLERSSLDKLIRNDPVPKLFRKERSKPYCVNIDGVTFEGNWKIARHCAALPRPNYPPAPVFDFEETK